MKIYSIVLFILLISQQTVAQDTPVHKSTHSFFNQQPAMRRVLRFDSSSIQPRSFSDQKIREFKSDPDFRYENLVEPPKSIWDRFWSWFWYQLSQLFSTIGGERAIWTIGVIAALAILTYFVVKVTGMNRTTLFARKDTTLAYSEGGDNIHDISFNQAIEDAIASGNFRLALRLLYLQTLKQLSDTNQIDWQINKTNSDYLHETSGKSWASLFKNLTFNFEYAWYGEMPVAREHFTELQQQFIQLNNQLRT